jgi:hypothetical protein
VTAPAAGGRVEIRLGAAFWVVAGTAATLRGAFAEFLPYAAPVAAAFALWPLVRARPWARTALDWAIDPWLAEVDAALLGDQAARLLEPVVAWPLTVAMSVSYACYYPLLVAAAVWFLVRCPRTAFREYAAGIVGSLFLGYLGYLFLPALGPHAWFSGSPWTVPLEGDFVGPAIRALNANHGGAFPRDAFPSLHTANAITILLVALRHDRRALAAFLVPCAGLVAATVYLRWHYVVDLAAGAALAVAWQAAVPGFVAREGAARADCPAGSPAGNVSR